MESKFDTAVSKILDENERNRHPSAGGGSGSMGRTPFNTPDRHPSAGGGGSMGRTPFNTPDKPTPKKPPLDAEPPPPPLGMVTTPTPPTEPAGGAFDTATKWVADNKPLAAGLGGAAAALLAAKLLKKKEEKERRR
tara:strand:+ start:1607 stop:2014 length:408 start_codon:yes stop_codon:yes gene_type:complete